MGARLQIDDIVPSPLAAARSVLTPQQKELGVALIDIGAATTSLAVFEEGELIHLAVFPLGSANITNDIAIGLKTQLPIAEDIKRQHGTCILTKTEKGKKDKVLGPERKKIEVFDKSYPVSFTKKLLVDIIEPRVWEILNLVQKELKLIGRQELLPGGVVLTGGGVKLPKIKDLVKQHLKLPCQMGIPKGIVGLLEDPSLSTVAGLVLGAEDPDESEKKGILAPSGFFKRVKKIFKVFLP